MCCWSHNRRSESVYRYIGGIPLTQGATISLNGSKKETSGALAKAFAMRVNLVRGWRSSDQRLHDESATLVESRRTPDHQASGPFFGRRRLSLDGHLTLIAVECAAIGHRDACERSDQWIQQTPN